MAADRQIQETVAWCVSTVVLYHNSARIDGAAGQLADEAGAIAGFVEMMGLDSGAAERQIVRPLRDELTARYGHELGPRLLAAFTDAFEAPRAVNDERRRRDVGRVGS